MDKIQKATSNSHPSNRQSVSTNNAKDNLDAEREKDKDINNIRDSTQNINNDIISAKSTSKASINLKDNSFPNLNNSGINVFEAQQTVAPSAASNSQQHSQRASTETMASSLQSQVKNFIDDINNHKSRTHFILDSLLNQYNSTLKKYTAAGKKLQQIEQLLQEFNNEISDASKEMSVHAFNSISCRHLGEPIQLSCETIQIIVKSQQEVYKSLRQDILEKIYEKIESDTKYLKQQITIFSSEYRANVRNFNNCSDNLKSINSKILSLQQSEKTQKSKKNKENIDQQTSKLKQEFKKHENLAKNLLTFCEENFDNASTEEQRRFNFFHSKQMFMLDEYSSLAINIVNEAKKLSTTLLPPEPEGDPETEMPVIQNREQVQQIVRSQSTVSSRDIAVQVRSNSSRDRARSGERSSMKSAKSKGDIRSSRKLKDVSEIVLTNAILQRQPNIDTQPFLREPTPPALQVCAKHSYNGKSSKQMSFLSGDLIKVVINESKSGWKYGENCRSRERGWFPETYLSGFG